MKPQNGIANNKKNIVVAHRGAFKANGLPENSIASLTEAIRLKCAGSEFDIWMTKDDSLVINHDANFFGLTIENASYADLLQFKHSNGEKIPTLREYLLAGKQENPSTQLVLEIKPSAISRERGEYVAAKVLEMVNETGVDKYVSYISFDYNVLLKILRIRPKAVTQYLSGNKTPEELKKDGIAGLDYNQDVYKKNPGWVDEAKKLGLILNVWTVNRSEDLDYFIQQGFDYITTNEPELLFSKLK